jgi:hypothetical protein
LERLRHQFLPARHLHRGQLQLRFGPFRCCGDSLRRTAPVLPCFIRLTSPRRRVGRLLRDCSISVSPRNRDSPPHRVVRQRARFHFLEIVERQRMQCTSLQALNNSAAGSCERPNVGGNEHQEEGTSELIAIPCKHKSHANTSLGCVPISTTVLILTAERRTASAGNCRFAPTAPLCRG